MAMLIVDDTDFESELDRFKDRNPDSNNVGEIRDIERGRGEGNTEVPESLRKIIGETALIETNKETARAFGVSESSVSAYKNGATSTSTYHQPDNNLQQYLDKSREKISKKARRRLLLALDSITPDKLNGAKLKDISGVARDMSSVIRNIEPQQETTDVNVKFVFFAPKLREEKEYSVITVNE